MTLLQWRVLKTLTENGPQSVPDLVHLCLIEPKQEGGFRHTLHALFHHGYCRCDPWRISITERGRTAMSDHDQKLRA